MDQNKSINVLAVSWARQNIPYPVKNNPEWGKFIFLFTFFAIITILFFVLAIVFASRGSNEYSVFERYVLRNLCLAVFFLPLWVICFLVFRSFVRKIKVIDSEGIKTVLNKKYSWENLYYVNFAVYSNYTVNVTRKGRKLNVIEVFFENGMADTFYTNQQIIDLLNQIPSQKRRNGIVINKQ